MYNDVNSEMSFIGGLFNSPIEYINYGKLIESSLDFSDESNRFLYEKFEAFYIKYLMNSNSSDISELQFNVFMNSDDNTKQTYSELGGFRLINRLKALGDSNNIEVYYNGIKKASLMRELEDKGFPIQKIMAHKKFEILSAEDIERIMQYNLNNIMTKVTKGKGVSDMTQGMVDLVEGYCVTPYIGTPYKFSKLTDYLMGMNKGDILITFGFVNSGKSRKDIAELADLVFIQNKKVLKLDNEMSEIKCKNALITTVCNDPAYNFNLKVNERSIKLGEYRSLEEKKKVLEVARFVESYSDRWFFKSLTDYSDEKIEMAIKSAVISRGVEHVAYGTLKGHGRQQSDWSTLKVTVNNLKSLAEEFDLFMSLKAQLTMTSGKLSIWDLDEDNIGESKGIAQICDFAIIDKEISKSDVPNCYVKKNGNNEYLSDAFRWNGSKIIKNRDGGKTVFVQPYDLDLNYWGQLKELYCEF